MNVLMHSLHFVCVVAPVVTSGYRNPDPAPSRLGERKQTLMFFDQGEVGSIRKVPNGINPITGEDGLHG
jgi:hypothetical protein